MSLDSLKVDLAVALGKARIPVRELLQMNRGALVALDPTPDETVDILAGGHLVARGRVEVRADRVVVEVTELVRKPDSTRVPGTTLGGATWIGERERTPAAA